MSKRLKTLLRSILLVAGITGISYGQIPLTGMVADSTTMLSLQNVNISVQGKMSLTVSDLRGYFSIDVSEADTLVFSIVGYNTKVLPVEEVQKAVVIFLSEENKVLPSIMIEDRKIIPWLPKLPAESPWKNSTNDISATEIPGFRGIQTFGPGYVFSGPISRFSKYEKERKKLKKIQEENYHARNYVEIVNAPEVKGKIMKDYDFTEEDYYRLLAVFNEKNKDIIYRLEANELIALLLIFYAENADKK